MVCGRTSLSSLSSDDDVSKSMQDLRRADDCVTDEDVVCLPPMTRRETTSFGVERTAGILVVVVFVAKKGFSALMSRL